MTQLTFDSDFSTDQLLETKIKGKDEQKKHAEDDGEATRS
jgi:hypothetical protein